MNDEEVRSLGASIGRRLAEAKTSAAQPTIKQHPTVKLPELCGDAEVKRWLDERGLARGQLRQTLTEVRRASRDKTADKVFKNPRRATQKKANAPASSTESPAEIANRPQREL